MTTRAVTAAASLAAAVLLAACTSDGAGDPVPMPTVDYSGPAADPDTPDETADDALVLSECGDVRGRVGGGDRRTEYLGGDPEVVRVRRGEEYDLGSGSTEPRTRVGAAVTAPEDAGAVEVSRGLERRIARALGVQVGTQVRAAEDGPGNTFTNRGPTADLVFVDYVTYRVARWSAEDCLAFPGRIVRGTLTYDMIGGDGILSCEPDARGPGTPMNGLLDRICPS